MKNLLPLVALVLVACDMGMLHVNHEGPDGENTEFVGYPNSPTDPTGPTDPRNPGANQPDPTLPAPLLHNVTFGERCVGGERVRYLVLGDEASTCSSDAGRIDSVEELNNAVVLPASLVNGPTSVRYCNQGACEDAVLNFSLTDNGNSLNGTWSGTLLGEGREISFTGSVCEYDQALPPIGSDRLAGGIAIKELAVYQGIKVALIRDSQILSQRNAPVVAGRPGVVRVFLEPQSDWQSREVMVRLTLGDEVLEQSITPTGASSETSFASTVNFQFDEGELPANVDYSVEILEVDGCSAPAANVVSARFPAEGMESLQSENINPMRVVLVPIQYNADGSGRVPTLDAAAVARFRNEMYVNYPVRDLEFTVRDPVATQQGLAPNGSGFSSMLNLCLNVRAQDSPDPDVYYYCLIQPTNTRNQFCGGGCVGGIAPLAPANSVSNRAGIGIAFDGVGEDIFVHEIGHALGRPHAPCGGAAGTDPDFPHAGGRIGTWGYDVMNNSLIDPQAPDFMGYCDPSWVSDYTYNAIFQRLKYVLGVQAFMAYTEPKTWKTGVVELNGELVWGDDLTLEHVPFGDLTTGTVLDLDGHVVAQIEVYVTEVSCDLETVLLTMEDPGLGAHSVIVNGVSYPVANL